MTLDRNDWDGERGIFGKHGITTTLMVVVNINVYFT